jgi:phage gpG-like protein
MTSPMSSAELRGGSDFVFFRGDLISAIDGLGFRRNLKVGWQINPSIGIVAKDVDRLADVISSFREPLSRSVKRVVIPSIQENFRAEGRPPWDPLAERTVSMRKSSGPILRRTGNLERAATSFDIWAIGDTSATVRSLPPGAWYGAVHQSGYAGGAGRGFGRHITAAKSELGPRAGGMEVVRQAFSIMDAATGGPKGQSGGSADIPQRRFIMFQDEDIEGVEEVFLEWLEEMVVLAGRWGGGATVI